MVLIFRTRILKSKSLCVSFGICHLFEALTKLKYVEFCIWKSIFSRSTPSLLYVNVKKLSTESERILVEDHDESALADWMWQKWFRRRRTGSIIWWSVLPNTKKACTIFGSHSSRIFKLFESSHSKARKLVAI